MSWTVIFSQADIQAGNSKVCYLNTPQGCSLVVYNQSPYDVQVQTQSGQLLDIVPGRHSVTMPYEAWQSLVFVLDPSVSDGLSFSNEYVAVRLVKGTVTYQRSALYPQLTQVGNTPSVLVNNPQTQPVPTQPQTFYGTGADGAFAPYANLSISSLSAYTLLSGSSPADLGGGQCRASLPFAMCLPISADNPRTNQVLMRISFTQSNGSGAYVQLYVNNSGSITNGDGFQLVWQPTDNNIVLYQIVNGNSIALADAGANIWAPTAGHVYEFRLTLLETNTTNYLSGYVQDLTSSTMLWHFSNVTSGSYIQPWVFTQGFGLNTSNTCDFYYGDFYPLYLFNNIANQAEIKNFTSINIPANVTVSWANPAHYVCWFCQGSASIAGTIQAAMATPGVASNMQPIKLFQEKISIPLGGAGGAGGAGGGSTGGAGGSGGAASPYGSGAGGGGGGGGSDFSVSCVTSGAPGTNGNAFVSGGQGGAGTSNSTAGNPGQSVLATGTAPFILVSSGSINVSGQILAQGSAGGAGGNGGQSNQSGSTYYMAGCGGGGAGAGAGGTGGNGGNGFTSAYGESSVGGGGGGGGSGGGSVVLYSGGAVQITGSINVNGGAGGAGGAAGSGGAGGQAGLPGQAGQAGSVAIYQYNHQISG